MPDRGKISQEFKMSWEELWSFHNSHCAVYELLPKLLPKYLEYIYIPTDKYEEWQEEQISKTEKIDVNEQQSITYGVLVLQPSSNTKIHYLIHLKKLSEHSISLSREQVFVNDAAPDLVLEKMMDLASTALYPLEISVDEHGAIDKIGNAQEIKSRWKKNTLPSIQQYYAGDVAANLVRKMDSFYEKIDTSPSLLEKEFFLQLFLFLKINLQETSRETADLSIYLPVVPRKITYQTIIGPRNRSASADQMLVEIRGHQKKDYRSTSSVGNISLDISISRRTHAITAITGMLSAEENNQEKQIFVEIYEMNEYI